MKSFIVGFMYYVLFFSALKYVGVELKGIVITIIILFSVVSYLGGAIAENFSNKKGK